MTGNLWLSWFAMVLAVGVAATLLGRRRALPASGFGALLWVALSLSDQRTGAAGDPLLWLGLAAGAVVIVGIGLWLAQSSPAAPPMAHGTPDEPRATEQRDTRWENLSSALERFDDWLATNRHRADPWPDFGEFLRSMLLATCKARHIRAYRLLATDDEQLSPLRRLEPEEHDFPSARRGLIGHVLTSGRSYLRGDPTHGDLVDQLARAEENGVGCDWCFAIRQQGRPVGIVWVGELESAALAQGQYLALVEQTITLCWAMVAEACRSRLAGFIDPASGLMTHDAFMNSAAESIEAAYAQGEPVALAAIGLEGMRSLADNGRWDVANRLRQEVSTQLKERIRLDDRIGILDESRYLLLLRRVDSGLAELIVRQLIDRLVKFCTELDGAALGVQVRCGLAGSGTQQPTLRTLVTRATNNGLEARRQDVHVLSDLHPQPEVKRT